MEWLFDSVTPPYAGSIFHRSELNCIATDRIWLCSFYNNKTLEVEEE
jgi:hypothetical protein